MDFNEFISLIKKKKQTILSIVLIFLFVVLIATMLQPLKYRSTAKLLIVQSNNYSDAYSISRSNQFLGNVLSEVVYSNSFFEQVMDSGYNINKNIFSANQNKKIKQWRKTVSAEPISDTGIIVIYTYHKDKYQASQINQAIAYTLKAKHNSYHGLGDKVAVKIIDKTTTSNWPVKPNIVLNTIFSVFLGLLAGICFIYLYPEKELKFWSNRQRNAKLNSYNKRQEINSMLEKKDNSLPRLNNSLNVKEDEIYSEKNEPIDNATGPKNPEGGDIPVGDINNIFKLF
ncbi:MAG: Wzz/FepE/Etk N-terminal domain-containing protein [Patescibacteria group bacterium]